MNFTAIEKCICGPNIIQMSIAVRHNVFNYSKSYVTLPSLDNAIVAKKTNQFTINDNKQNEKSFLMGCIQDHRILYNCYINKYKVKAPFKIIKGQYLQFAKSKLKHQQEFATPVFLQNFHNSEQQFINEFSDVQSEICNDSVQNFPYNIVDQFDVALIENEGENYFCHKFSSVNIKDDINYHMKAYKESTQKNNEKPLEQEFDSSLENGSGTCNSIQDNYSITISGTSNPNIPASHIVCGGCGSKLHCQDQSFPGYVPSKMFEGKSSSELRSTLCQRCNYLKHYKVALNVRVVPEMYEKALKPIRKTSALAMVVVDVTDVPCSVWPGIKNILGPKRPVVIVANKVDLMPADGPNHLHRIKESLMKSLQKTSLWDTNICHIALLSAKTGFGIEQLVTKLQKFWGTNGDMYILGCTNSGKSTLFNALLSSDLCESQAMQLMHKATVSPWPGTTINMLKFPVLRMTGRRLFERKKRLREEQLFLKAKDLDREKFAIGGSKNMLRGFVHHTSRGGRDSPLDTNEVEEEKRLGINFAKWKYKESTWCYDTPGTVQPQQLLCLLTHEELQQVLCRETIQPRTFSLFSGQSLFIGGLCRLDLLYSTKTVRFTVFASHSLPISITPTTSASSFYKQYIGSPILCVPAGSTERLNNWPHLIPKNIWLTGCGRTSCADIVLSSAGFISVTAAEDEELDLRGWTPGGRGMYVRQPAMLPFSVTLRGKRIRRSPAFMLHRIYVPSHEDVNM